MENPNAPSSKLSAGAVVGTAIGGALYAADVAGWSVPVVTAEEFPDHLLTLVAALVAFWLKRERNPSQSAIDTMRPGFEADRNTALRILASWLSRSEPAVDVTDDYALAQLRARAERLLGRHGGPGQWGYGDSPTTSD